MNTTELLTLCDLCGTSGREHAVREYILHELEKISSCAVSVDKLGNVLVHKTGAQPGNKKVLFTAHMDEVALMITAVHADGTFAFDCVGGISAAAVIGRQVVVGRDLVPGVIGSRPVHLLSAEVRKKPAEISALCCDIGANNKEEAMQYAKPGDVIYFAPGAREIGDGALCAKAIDDRFGCALLLKLLRQEQPYDLDAAFLVQEEVGLRGAAVAANALDPDIAVILETTTAADIPGSEGADRVCALGGGAVISYMDGRTVYDKTLYDLAVGVCEENGIPWQTKTKIAGGNDAGAIQNAGRGTRVLAVSLPCRYLHAPKTVARFQDMDACCALAGALVSALQEAAL